MLLETHNNITRLETVPIWLLLPVVTALEGKVQNFLTTRQSNGFVIPPSLRKEMEQKFSASKQEIVESMMELQR